MKVTILIDLINSTRNDGLPVFIGYVHGKLRFGGKGGANVRRNHAAPQRIHGVNGNAPTIVASQTEYFIAYYDE